MTLQEESDLDVMDFHYYKPYPLKRIGSDKNCTTLELERDAYIKRAIIYGNNYYVAGIAFLDSVDRIYHFGTVGSAAEKYEMIHFELSDMNRLIGAYGESKTRNGEE